MSHPRRSKGLGPGSTQRRLSRTRCIDGGAPGRCLCWSPRTVVAVVTEHRDTLETTYVLMQRPNWTYPFWGDLHVDDRRGILRSRGNWKMRKYRTLNDERQFIYHCLFLLWRPPALPTEVLPCCSNSPWAHWWLWVLSLCLNNKTPNQKYEF